MKVVIIGGYGVFGTCLSHLLMRDGHDVVIAGRSLQSARALAAELGATPLCCDRAGDLSALWNCAPDVVVDAAGPFHTYGDAPYALARACIRQGVNYLDLADDPTFCAGIAVLNDAAQKAGVFVLSGVSSVPAISSAVVASLAKGAMTIDTIDTALLPGNRAPRGRAVISSILHQCGRPFDVTIDGTTTRVRNWSRPASFYLGAGIKRQGWMIEVPDHRLFGPVFQARSVLFRAGLELGVMNYGLAVLSWIRSKLRFGISDWFVGLTLWAAKLLSPFGTDVGGMSVSVTGQFATGWRCRTWRMIARAGDGPFIPAVAARVVLRQADQITHGARPAVGVVDLAGITDGMADLTVEAETLDTPLIPAFRAHLGDEIDDLPVPVQEMHDIYGPRCWVGRGNVVRGTSVWSRFVARLFRFPKATDDIPVSVSMTPHHDGELWERQFGTQRFQSFLQYRDGVMTERFGPLTFVVGLKVEDDQLHFPVLSGRMGPIRIPSFLLPVSVAHEGQDEQGRFVFDVALMAPLTGKLIVHYRGWLSREN